MGAATSSADRRANWGDEKLHGFEKREIMLIVQGVHGYVSQS
jgi:hypothetical protein